MSSPRRMRSFAEQTLHYFDRPHAGRPSTRLTGPAAWHGSRLQSRSSEWRERLSEEELMEIERALDEIERTETPIEEIDPARFPLPGLAARIDGWRRQLAAGRGFVLVSGLPVEAWGEARSALAFWGLGQHLGLPGAQNAANDLLGHVRDTGEQIDSPNVRLYRTASDIGFHCDAADVVGLLCLRTAAEGGESRIASSVAIWNALFEEDPERAALLFEPFALDRRDEHPEGARGWLEIPPCRFDASGRLRTFHHGEYFRSVARLPEIGPLPPDRIELLDRYDAWAGSPELRLDMALEPGDMQLLSNHTVVHARTAYRDHPEPERRRHLLRLWLSLDEGAETGALRPPTAAASLRSDRA